MRHRNGTDIGAVATQPLTARRQMRVKPPAREPTISRYVEQRIRIEMARDEEAMLAPVGGAIRLELEIQAHDHACVNCGRRLLEEVVCPDCGNAPEWVRQPKGATR